MGDMQTVSARRAIGIGCTSSATIEDVVSLIRTSIEEVGSDTILATLERRARIAYGVAAVLGLAPRLFPSEHLAIIVGITRSSSMAASIVGTPSVAEAAALAALGRSARLIVPRRTGHHCTCAVAELP
ncbi:MAG TPA: cobalamin biosynthesis protein [Candidatus Baltobacteraceae bacterium]|jgi:cobalamin biosynthesis protein CbiG|nr:cobalamin biosynthesis protein [Candidatus Baltobacteraceae bacterium]